MSIWDYLLDKYRNDNSAKELIFVKYKNYSYADVFLYVKNKSDWECVLKCDGYLSRKGIGDANVASDRTPEGDFKVSIAYGIKPNPGNLNIDYLQATEGIYCCGDQGPYYNKIINAKELNHDCKDGEHLIEYPDAYSYGLWFDYNKKCEYQKGFAFLFHCKGNYNYTDGCISVSEENMLKILKKLHPNARLCIYDLEKNI